METCRWRIEVESTVMIYRVKRGKEEKAGKVLSVLVVHLVLTGAIAKDLLSGLGASFPVIPFSSEGMDEFLETADIVELALTTASRGERILATLSLDGTEETGGLGRELASAWCGRVGGRGGRSRRRSGILRGKRSASIDCTIVVEFVLVLVSIINLESSFFAGTLSASRGDWGGTLRR